MRVEKSRTTGVAGERSCEIALGLEHQLARTARPARPAGARCPSARGARRARRASPRAPCTRPSFRVRRALMPWRTHTSSSASFLSNLSASTCFVGERLLLAPQVRRVVAGPRRQLAAIELDDPRRQPLQERAVVGDEHHGAVVLGEKALEPLDGVDVEMIGRLVEQQQIRLADQRARQQHAAAPAARQRVDDRVGRQLEPRQDQLDVMLAQPRFVLLEMMRVPFGDDVEHRAVGGERDVLLEPRDAQRRLPPDRAGVRRRARR